MVTTTGPICEANLHAEHSTVHTALHDQPFQCNGSVQVNKYTKQSRPREIGAQVTGREERVPRGENTLRE